ncbi:porin [Zemynaea arenosa]|nr:porin [Massilia arenosa]
MSLRSHPLIFAAVLTLALLFALPASADLQLYGRLNVSVERRTEAGGPRFQVGDNASRFGIMEVERTRSGLESGVHLEMGFDATTGKPYGSGFDRGAELFFGTPNVKLSMGSVGSTAYLAITDVVSLHNHDTGISSDALFAHVEPLQHKMVVTLHADRWTMQAASWRADPMVTGRAGTAYLLAWTRPGMSLALSSGQDGVRYERSVRGLWQAGPLELAAYVELDRNVFGSGRRLLGRVAVAWHAGASEFHVNVAQASAYGGALPGERGARQRTLGYNYNLSARSKVYALATAVYDEGRLYGSRRALALGVRQNF